MFFVSSRDAAAQDGNGSEIDPLGLKPDSSSNNDIKGINLYHILDAKSVQLVDYSGAEWVRINLQYGAGDLITALKAQNPEIKIIGLITHEACGMPYWGPRNYNAVEAPADTPPDGEKRDGNNEYVRAFATQAGQLARDYGEYIDYWEIWNEPDDYAYNPELPDHCVNTPEDLYNMAPLCPSVFAQMLAQASVAIKTNDPNDAATVISGGVIQLGVLLAGGRKRTLTKCAYGNYVFPAVVMRHPGRSRHHSGYQLGGTQNPLLRPLLAHFLS